MSVSNGTDIKQLGNALFSATDSTGKTRTEAALVRRIAVCPIADVAADTATLAERIMFTVPANLTNGIRVKAVTYTSTVAIPAHATDNRTFTLKKYNAAGGGGTTVGTLGTDSDVAGYTSVTALVPAAFTLTASAVDVVAGGILTLSGAGGGGTEPAITGAVLTIDYEEL